MGKRLKLALGQWKKDGWWKDNKKRTKWTETEADEKYVAVLD